MKHFPRFAAAALLLALAAPAAHAVNPNERLADPVLEARARALSKELRCMVCQNELIDDSNADLAHDLRVLVRERLQDGDSDAQVIAYLRARYGDFILLNPPVEPSTYLLWYGPAAVTLAAAGALLFAAVRRRRDAAPVPEPLAPDEARRLAELLQENGDRRL